MSGFVAHDPSSAKFMLEIRRSRGHRNDLARFTQNTTERPAISRIQADRQLLLIENFAHKCVRSAGLFHCRYPFRCASSTLIIGSVSHPAADRPSHIICVIKISRTIANERGRVYFVGQPEIKMEMQIEASGLRLFFGCSGSQTTTGLPDVTS